MNDSINSSVGQPATTADISAYQPPTQAAAVSSPVNTVAASPVPATGSTPATTNTESLESQNIFDLLGVNDGSDADKEAFLDELQQVIWQDFLDNDLQLLLTKEELTQVKTLQAKTPDVAKQQEEIVTFLENLIPDLEDIMLEKALELKREMVRERIEGLREYLASQPEKLTQLQVAEDLIKQNKWASATGILNKAQA